MLPWRELVAELLGVACRYSLIIYLRGRVNSFVSMLVRGLFAVRCLYMAILSLVKILHRIVWNRVFLVSLAIDSILASGVACSIAILMVSAVTSEYRRLFETVYLVMLH